MTDPTGTRIGRLPADFADWTGLLQLILEAFAYMDGVIDPPSSAKALTEESLARKARDEICLVATDGEGRVVGCIFVAAHADHVYIGKLAVTPAWQRKNIGQALVAAAEDIARAASKPELELQTRIELTGNHAAFARLGFREILRGAHPGYDRPTFITMRKAL